MIITLFISTYEVWKFKFMQVNLGEVDHIPEGCLYSVIQYIFPKWEWNSEINRT